MSSFDTRVAQWVDVAAEMLSAPLTEFPVGVLGRGLIDSFDADYAAVNWRRADGSVGLDAVTRPGSAHGGYGGAGATAVATAAAASPLLDHHPLVRWFLATGDGGPQSLSRVPEAFRSVRSAEAVELLHSIGADQELAIPLHLHGFEHHVVVLGRAGWDDFSDEDVAVARRLQPLLLAVHRQVTCLACGTQDRPARDFGLSGRELAVLQLVATGRTAGAIGWALGCSPRTVQKHVEHVYRKLGVRDRVNAVRVGREAGLVPTPASPHPDAVEALMRA